MARVGYYEIDSLKGENVANENTQLTESVILARRRRKLFEEELVVIKKRFTTAENIHLFHCLSFDILYSDPLTKYIICGIKKKIANIPARG